MMQKVFEYTEFRQLCCKCHKVLNAGIVDLREILICFLHVVKFVFSVTTFDRNHLGWIWDLFVLTTHQQMYRFCFFINNLRPWILKLWTENFWKQDAWHFCLVLKTCNGNLCRKLDYTLLRSIVDLFISESEARKGQRYDVVSNQLETSQRQLISWSWLLWISSTSNAGVIAKSNFEIFVSIAVRHRMPWSRFNCKLFFCVFLCILLCTKSFSAQLFNRNLL